MYDDVALTCMQIGQKVMHAPHLVHMHWCPQSKHTVFIALLTFATQENSGRRGSAGQTAIEAQSLSNCSSTYFDYKRQQ